MIALTLLCVAAVAVLLAATATHRRWLELVSKPVASAAFIAVGFVAVGGASPLGHDYATRVLAGLVLGAAGDVALLGESKRAFLAGLVLFLLGHLAYVAAFAALVPPAAWVGGLAVAPFAVGAVVLALLWSRLGSMRAPVVAYVVVIGLMVAGALAVVSHRAGGAASLRIALGAVLFWLSDLAVARDRFVGKSFVNRAWGLPAYYGGQLVLAWSLAG